MGTDIIRMLSGARIKMRGGVNCEFFSKSGIISVFLLRKMPRSRRIACAKAWRQDLFLKQIRKMNYIMNVSSMKGEAVPLFTPGLS